VARRQAMKKRGKIGAGLFLALVMVGGPFLGWSSQPGDVFQGGFLRVRSSGRAREEKISPDGS